MLKEDTEIGLTINGIGNSAGPAIPAKWRRRLGVEKGDIVDAEADFEENAITFHF